MPESLATLQTALAERYNVQRELGRGGMATVYLAQDLKHQRRVAIKVFEPELAAIVGPQRFLREITLTAQLDHPHILALIDSGETERFLYYVMPYVEGETLRDRLNRETQLPLDDAVQITLEVADALGYAHSYGIVHRDIKPENILLAGGHARVADFGIARAVAEAGGENLTATGLAIGTPAYMSPEQADGGTEVDGRSDLYSLGCVLYEMLAGEPPHTGTSALAIFAKRWSEPAPRVSVLRETVPALMEGALNRALARTPADRFATAAQFATALRHETGSATPSSGERARAPVLRRPFSRQRSAAIVAAGLMVLAGLGWWALSQVGLLRVPPAADAAELRVVAVLPFEQIAVEAAGGHFAAGMHPEILSHLSRVGELRLMSTASVAALGEAPDRMERLVSELGVGSIVEGSVRVVGERARIDVQLTDARSGRTLWAEQYDRELSDVLAVQADVALRIADALRLHLTPQERELMARPPTQHPEAYELYLRGNAARALNRDSLMRAIGFYREATRLDPGFAMAHAHMAQAYGMLSGTGERFAADSGRAAVQRALEADSALALAHFARGQMLSRAGLHAESRLAFLRALEFDPNDVPAMADLSLNLTSAGRLDESLHWAEEALKRAPNLALAYYHAGIPLLALGDDAATERFLLEGLDRTGPDWHHRVHGLLAWLDVYRGRPREAFERMRIQAVTHPQNFEVRSELASVARFAGAAEADSLIDAYYRFNRAARLMYAGVLLRRGDTARAERLLAAAHAAATARLEAAGEGPGVNMRLARIHALRGEHDATLDWLERAYDVGYRDHRALRAEPNFASLRESPRFLELEARMEADVARMRARAATSSPLLRRLTGEPPSAVHPSHR